MTKITEKLENLCVIVLFMLLLTNLVLHEVKPYVWYEHMYILIMPRAWPTTSHVGIKNTHVGSRVVQ